MGSGDKTAHIWDAVSFKEIAILRGHEGWVGSASFSADGRRIVTTSEDKTTRIWDAGTFKEIAILRGHEGPVYSAALNPDGTLLVTTSMDKTARIWQVRLAIMPTEDLVKEVCSRPLRGLTKFNRDEMRLAGYSDDMPEIDACAGVE
jgi:WD40 repeat protein